MKPDVSKLNVSLTNTIRDAMQRISNAAAAGLPSGLALVVGDDGVLMGLVTDGDVRRGLLAGLALDDLVERVAVRDPIVFSASLSDRQVLEAIPRRLVEKGRYRGGVMEKVILVDDRGRVERVIDFLDLWRSQQMRHRHINVVGLGYVGLTLAVTFADSGYKVTGIESNPQILSALRAGRPHIYEAGLEPLLRHQLGRNLAVCGDLSADAEVHVLAVATPIDENRVVSIEQLLTAAEHVGRVLHYGDLVVMRSTVPVGTSRNRILPILEQQSALKCGRDFSLAFAPERTVAGRALAELKSLPQVIGGFDQNAAELATSLFREITPSIVGVGSLEEAEMVKLVNNSYRDLSFAFANEVSVICEHFHMQTSRVLAAANDGYPRGHVPNPSPGVGGSCLKKDPYMFMEVAKAAGISPCLSTVGRHINEMMPGKLVEKIVRALQRVGKTPEHSCFFLMGFAFKGEPETSDMRDSTSLDVLQLLRPIAGEIRGYDPVVPRAELEALGVKVCDRVEGFAGADCALILNNHRSYVTLDIYACLATMKRPAIYCDTWGILSPDDLGDIEDIACLGLSTAV